MTIVTTQLVSPDVVYTKTKDEIFNGKQLHVSGKLINVKRLLVLTYMK